MKKRFLLIFSMAIILACLFVIAINATNIKGIDYTLTKGVDGADNTANINSHKNKTLSVTEIYIPEYVEHEGEKYYVTSMSSTTFESTNITSVIFDKNCRVTVIPQWAFKNCSKLIYMDLHDGITTISSDAFNGNTNMVRAGGALPASLTSLAGSSFTNCKSHGITTLVVPAGVTEFASDTGLQHAGTITTIVFLGKMTKVSFQYYGNLTVYFAANSVNDLNGNYVDSRLENGVPYYTVSPVEQYDGKNYYVKSNGTLNITAFSGNNYNSSGNVKTDADGNKIAPANVNQDRFYFCKDDKVVYAIRNSNIAGNWNSYLAVYDTVVGDTTYKLNPHLQGTAQIEPNTCYSVVKCVACSYILSQTPSVEATGHKTGEVLGLTYDNGYLSGGKIKFVCAECKLEVYGTELTPALVEGLGYSVATFGNTLSVVQGYRFNIDAINVYKEQTTGFEMGFVAAVNASGEDVTLDISSDKVVSGEISLINNYADIVVNGITESTSNVNIIFCLYIIDNEEIYFLDGGETKTSISGVSYNDVLKMD